MGPVHTLLPILADLQGSPPNDGQFPGRPDFRSCISEECLPQHRAMFQFESRCHLQVTSLHTPPLIALAFHSPRLVVRLKGLPGPCDSRLALIGVFPSTPHTPHPPAHTIKSYPRGGVPPTRFLLPGCHAGEISCRPVISEHGRRS